MGGGKGGSDFDPQGKSDGVCVFQSFMTRYADTLDHNLMFLQEILA
jgi:glutamate dehydrogenase/leucine dehydrogenase